MMMAISIKYTYMCLVICYAAVESAGCGIKAGYTSVIWSGFSILEFFYDKW